VTRERFEALALAYGGDISRWPAELRDEAALLTAAEPAFTHTVLSREDRLDEVLDKAPRTVAAGVLFDAIVASAPPLRRRRRWRLWIAPAGLGAGLAAVTAAGVLLGVQLGAASGARSETSSQAVSSLDVSSVSEIG
jgi:hypothetical protein